jgi:hypothetical protein
LDQNLKKRGRKGEGKLSRAATQLLTADDQKQKEEGGRRETQRGD